MVLNCQPIGETLELPNMLHIHSTIKRMVFYLIDSFTSN